LLFARREQFAQTNVFQMRKIARSCRPNGRAVRKRKKRRKAEESRMKWNAGQMSIVALKLLELE